MKRRLNDTGLCASCSWEISRTFRTEDIIKADIRFGNGSIHRCVGRVVNQESVPFIDVDDVKRHVARVNVRNPDALTIVRIIREKRT